MIFKRTEVVRVCRYQEETRDEASTAEILDKLNEHHVTFTMKIRGMNPLYECRVVQVNEDRNVVVVTSKKPHRVRVASDMDKIEEIEATYNQGLCSNDNDDGGRWSRLVI